MPKVFQDSEVRTSGFPLRKKDLFNKNFDEWDVPFQDYKDTSDTTSQPASQPVLSPNASPLIAFEITIVDIGNASKSPLLTYPAAKLGRERVSGTAWISIFDR